MIYGRIERRWLPRGGFGRQVFRAWGVYRWRGYNTLDRRAFDPEIVLVTPDEGIAFGVCAAPERPLDPGFERPMKDWRTA